MCRLRLYSVVIILSEFCRFVKSFPAASRLSFVLTGASSKSLSSTYLKMDMLQQIPITSRLSLVCELMPGTRMPRPGKDVLQINILCCH